MSHVKTFLFLACCFLVGVGIATAVVKFRAHRASGATPAIEAGNAPPLHGFYLPLDGSPLAALAEISAVHGSAVALNYPSTAGSSVAGIMKSVVAEAHRLGLKAVLVPPAMFASRNPYPVELTSVAAQAQAAKVDVLCLSWLNVDAEPGYWNAQAALVRKIFHGRVILAATAEILLRTECTQCVDFIGAIGPMNLPQRLPHAPDDVDLHAMRGSWGCVLDELESLAMKQDKPLMLLNMVVPLTIRAKLATPGDPTWAPTPNPGLQLLAYEALLYETKARGSVEGIFLPAAAPWPENLALSRKIESLWSGRESAGLPAPTAAVPSMQEDAADPG